MEDSMMNDILPEHVSTISNANTSSIASGSSSIQQPQQQPGQSSTSTIASTNTTSTTSTFTTHKRNSKDRRMRLEKIGLYRVGRTLGHGNFAHVRTGYHEIANTKVAIKIVDTQTIDAENIAKINREIQILQRINHPYIVKLYEVIRTDRYWYIITEYVGGGELFEMLTEKGKQPELEARRLFQQIVSAVAGCHGSGVVHRDIKAENLLLDKDNNAKLIDFGFSNFQKPNSLLSTWCGSPPYAAPELLLGQEYDGTKSDVWSLGVILYILVTAGFPFPGDSVDKLKRAVLSEHLRIPFWVSVECADLIRKMLTVSPSKRYSLAQVSQHRWFTENISDTMRDLVKSSLSNERRASPSPAALNLTVDRRLSTKILDPAVMIFMQQHTNWTEEQIVEDVLKQNFEGPIFATYELLNNKLAEYKDNIIQLESDEHPRRGSRGSILSGKANVEPETSQTTIPAHHLAKLSLSTSQDYDSDDSSASDLTTNEESSSSPRYRVGGAYSRRRMRRNLYQNIPEQQPSEQRRHTLCAADRLPINPLISTPQLPLDSVALANAAAIAMANFARLQQLQRQHQQLLQQHKLANTITGNLPALVNIPVSQERRASANEALLGLNSYAHLLAAACSTMGVPNAADVNSQNTSNPSTHHPTVEEEGQSYLNHYGLSKRNTLHAVSGMSSLNGIPSGSQQQQQQPRHNRTPYAKQNGNERRSSWASATSSSTAAAAGLLSQTQQAQLEKLYRQSIGGGTTSNTDALTGVQQLQREFQKLKACTQEQQQTQQNPLSNRSFSMIPPSILEINPPPTISITDEHNRCFPPVSGPYDPMSFMSQSGQGHVTQSLTGHPRPATVIGLASTSSTAGTPDSQPSNSSAMTIDSSGKSNAAVKYYFIPVSLEVALERLPKFADATENLIYEIAPDTDLSKDMAHVRFSHKNGVLFEMILHRMNQSPNISRTEFFMLNGEQSEYDTLRTQLLAVFNEIC
jgi:serine/threonine protein kinase